MTRPSVRSGLAALRARGGLFRTGLSVPAIRRLFVADFVSEVGDWAARLALSVLVFSAGGGALGAAGVWVVSLLPWVGLGQLLATVADRISHRTVMLVANLVRAVLFGVLAFVELPIPAVLAIAFIAALADPPFNAANAAALPLLAGETYGAARLVYNLMNQVSVLIGYGLGGVAVAVTDPRIALGVNAATFAVNVGIVATIPHTRSVEETDEVVEKGPGTFALLRTGARELVATPIVRLPIIVVTVSSFSGLAAESILVVYAAERGIYDGLGLAVLAVTIPVAAIVATPFYPAEGEHRHLVAVVVRITLVAGAAAVLLFVFDLPFPYAVLPLALLGILEVTMVPAGTVVMLRLPTETRASSIGVLQGSLRVTQLLGALSGGALAAIFSASTTLALVSLPTVAVGVYGLFALRKIAATPEGESTVIEEGEPGVVDVPHPREPAEAEVAR